MMSLACTALYRQRCAKALDGAQAPLGLHLKLNRVYAFTVMLHSITHKHLQPSQCKTSVATRALPPKQLRPPYPTTSPSSSQPANLAYSRTDAVSSDLRLDLWRILLSAGSQQFNNTFNSMAEVVEVNVKRVRRLTIDPPPAGFPSGPSGDQAVSLLAGPLAFLTSVKRQYGSVVGLLLGGERVVLIADSEAAKQVMIDQADVFIKKGTAFFPGSSLTGNGLLVSDGDTWRRQRRLSNPAFRRSAVDAYGTAMVSSTADMLNRQWRAGGVRDVYADFNELTLRVTLEALFGFGTPPPGSSGSSSSGSASSDDASTIVAAVAKAFEFFTRRAGSGLMLPEWLPTWDNLEFGAAVVQLDKVVYGLIAGRRAELAQAARTGEAVSRTDLLQGLLTAVDEDGSGMSDTALRDELMTLLVAGQETSAILLGWACALLAHHPQAQARVAQELALVLQGRTPSAADVRSLPYLEAVVLEALRLYAPAYMVGRCACRDAQVSDYSLPAGTTVLISPYLMHREPAIWGADADGFKPDRWAVWQSKEGYAGFMTLLSGLGPNGSYLPFGGGPRNCVGTGFAMMEAMLVLASVVQRYQLSPPSPGAQFPSPKPLITLRPESVPLQVTMRV